MATKFEMTRDVNGYNGFGLPFCEDGESAVLANGVADTFTAPTTFPNWIAIFSYTPGASVYVDGITTATVPTGGVASSTSQLNPVARKVKAGQSISVITADTTSPVVQVSYLYCDQYTN